MLEWSAQSWILNSHLTSVMVGNRVLMFLKPHSLPILYPCLNVAFVLQTRSTWLVFRWLCSPSTCAVRTSRTRCPSENSFATPAALPTESTTTSPAIYTTTSIWLVTWHRRLDAITWCRRLDSVTWYQVLDLVLSYNGFDHSITWYQRFDSVTWYQRLDPITWYQRLDPITWYRRFYTVTWYQILIRSRGTKRLFTR